MSNRNVIVRNTRSLSAVACTCVFLAWATTAPAAEIHRAVLTNDVDLVERILDEKGDDAVHATMAGDITALHLAAAANNGPMVALLLAHGAATEARTGQGFTPLHWAASKDADEAARMLLAAGALVNARTGSGIMPLHWAAGKNATNVIRRLLLAGADVHATTDAGLEPLHWAVRQDAEAAAAMLAYQEVTEVLPALPTPTGEVAQAMTLEEAEIETGALLETAGLPGAPLDSPNPPVRELVVDLGRGEQFIFVWIESIGLLVGRYEVTNGQFRRFRPNHNSLFRDDFTLNDDLQPAVYVSWQDAVAYCDWLNKGFSEYLPPEGRFRLPTRSEWQAFAKCGTDRTYPWGNDWPPKYGNYSDLTARRCLFKWRGVSGYEDGCAVSCPVVGSGVNDWGLYGVAGNVWEWCEDWFDKAKTAKVRCGGSWDFDDEPCLRIDAKGFDRPDAKYATVGFRVVIGR